MSLPTPTSVPGGSPEPQNKPLGIWFNHADGTAVRFMEPVLFAHAWAIRCAGMYAILVPDDTYTPRKLRVIYFGEAGDFSTRITREHERFDDWSRAAGAADLYIAFHWMLASSQEERKEVERKLIEQYRPECNMSCGSLAMAAVNGASTGV